MNQAYEEPLVFTSNNQSKLYFSQVSKYPCNSKMIFNTLLVLKNVTYQSTRKDVTVISTINFIQKQKFLSISNNNEEEN